MNGYIYTWLAWKAFSAAATWKKDGERIEVDMKWSIPFIAIEVAVVYMGVR
jgi:hypothetical protein